MQGGGGGGGGGWGPEPLEPPPHTRSGPGMLRNQPTNQPTNQQTSITYLVLILVSDHTISTWPAVMLIILTPVTYSQHTEDVG